MGFARTFAAGTSVCMAAAAFLGAAVTVSYVKQVSASLPDHMVLADWKPARGTAILARDGSVLGEHAAERREFVPLAAVPRMVVDAFVAAEDGSYWKHAGVDPAAVVRAALSNMASPGTRPEGGSTITQQVVKNVILSPERTFDRKVREALLALRADRDVGKERVLEIYLNEIYFGSGAYGVAAASRTYFGKDVRELSLAEAALLAGLPKAPSAANPFTNPARAAERRAYVLGRMASEGYVTGDEASTAAASPLPSPQSRPAYGSSDPAFWYAQEAVRRILVREVGAERVNRDGADVATTFDPALQRAAHASLRAGLVAEDRRSGWRGPLARGVSLPPDWSEPALAVPEGAEDWKVAVVAETGRDARLVTADGEVALSGSSLAWATSRQRADAVLSPGDAVLVGDLGRGWEMVQVPAVQGALVALDPKTGGVLAMSGGFSHETSEFDRASQARRQTGSAFKPFVYLAALEMGYDAMSPVLDAPIAIEQGPGLGDWRPSGGSDGGLGLITIRRSLEMSRNMSTVRLLHDIGVERVADTAARAGLSLPRNAPYSMALGALEATPLEMAAAYAALANGGRRVFPVFFLGEEDDAHARAPDLDPVAVAQLASILEGVPTAGTARRAFDGFQHRVAAKTGTTNEARDAWLAAYAPGIAVVGWIGRDDHKPLARGAGGGATAAPMVRDFLDRISGMVDFGEFSLPEGASAVRADRDSGIPDDGGDVIEIVRTGGQR